MKRIAAVAAVLLALLPAGAARALGPVGTIRSEPVDSGSVTAGGGFLVREVRMVPKKSGYFPITVRQNHAYLQVADEAYGWEWSGRLGMADFSDGQQFDVGFKPFAGLGLRGYLFGSRTAEFGVVASFRADLYARNKVGGVPVAPGLLADVRVKDLWDAEAGLTAHRRFGPLTVYVGPVFEYVEAKVYRTTTVPVGTQLNEKSYYTKKTVGGVAGGLSLQKGYSRFGIEGGASSGSYTASVEAAIGF